MSFKPFHVISFGKQVVFLLLVTILVSLSGCSGRRALPPGVVRLRFSVLGEKNETDLAQAWVNAFEKEHPNIRVDIEPVAGMGYDMKLMMQSVAGTLPDVVFMADSLVPTFTKYHVVQNLWPYIKHDPTFNVKDIYPQMLETGMDDKGNLYMLPRELGVVVMFYNRTLFRKAGLPDPSPNWTYADFLRMAKKLTLKDSEGRTIQYGFNANYYWPGLWGPWVMSDGGQILSKDGLHSLLGTPAALKGLRSLIDLVTVYKVAPIPDPSLAAQGIDLFAQGRIAMQPGVFPSVPVYRATMKQFDWDVQIMPAGSVKRVVTMGAAGYGMSSQTKHPKEAWEFLKFILSPQGQRIMARMGSGIPALKSLAHDPCWRNSKLPPKNLDAFIDSLKYGMPWHDTLAFTNDEVADIVNTAFDKSFTQQTTIAKAFQDADAQIDKVFAQEKSLE